MLANPRLVEQRFGIGCRTRAPNAANWLCAPPDCPPWGGTSHDPADHSNAYGGPPKGTSLPKPFPRCTIGAMLRMIGATARRGIDSIPTASNASGCDSPREATLIQTASPPSPAELDFGLLFPRSRDALVVADSYTGLVALWNPAAEALFGYSAAEAVGRPLETFVPDELKDEIRANV